jgi:osmotically inducible protein OsmC
MHPTGPITGKYQLSSHKVLAHSRFPPDYALMSVIIRKASVRWQGGSRGGKRIITTDSGVLKHAKFSLGFPLKHNSHTDPTELIAAAHASSFSLALSRELRLTASAAGEIATVAMVTVEHLAAGWTVINIHLNVSARLPRVTQGRFIDATVRAKTNCLVSRLLRTNISMNAKLEKGAAARKSKMKEAKAKRAMMHRE